MAEESIRALEQAAKSAFAYLRSLEGRSVVPSDQARLDLSKLAGNLPQTGTNAAEVVRLLDQYASPATVASAAGRYFGFVTGGTLPAALGAGVLTAAWDQNAALEVMSPAAAVVEATAARWVINLLGLPTESVVGFTTGATMANFTALAAARQAILGREGWDVGANGLAGAPPVSIIVSEEVHVTVLKALSLLGFGRANVKRVPADEQGRLRADILPRIHGPAIVCLQAGNVNTGAFDPIKEVCERVRDAGAWVHVDGAFGLWALASQSFAPLAEGASLADSWATDAHKWLNVSYDSGLAIVRHPDSLITAMAVNAAYLTMGQARDGAAFVPEFSRRARGIEVWAALQSLGRDGVSELIERCCRLARQFASGMQSAGFTVLNEVVLNQVLVSFGSPDRTLQIVDKIQREGTCWCGSTVWQGNTAMRFSVSSWATTEADVDRSLRAILRIAN